MRVGTDIINITRIKELDDYALSKMLHPSELSNRNPEHLAGLIAAKEAMKKIIQNSDWLDYEITYTKNGKPQINTHHSFEGDISISHDGGFAIAVAVSFV